MNIDWNGEGLPPLGITVEVNHHVFGWTPADVVSPYEDYMICTPNSGGFYGYYVNEIRPIKTDKEKWVEQVRDIYSSHTEVSVMSVIYDALASGEIPMPKVTK